MAFRITRCIFYFLSVMLVAVNCRNACLAKQDLAGDCVTSFVQILQEQLEQLVQKDLQARIDQLALLVKQDLQSRREQLAQLVQQSLRLQQEQLMKEDLRFQQEQLNERSHQDLQLQKDQLAQLMKQDLLARQKQLVQLVEKNLVDQQTQLAQLVEQDLRAQQKQLDDLVQQTQRERLVQPAKEDLQAWQEQQVRLAQQDLKARQKQLAQLVQQDLESRQEQLVQLVQQDLHVQQEQLTQLARQVLEVQQEQLVDLAQQTLKAEQEQLAQLIQQALQVQKERPAISLDQKPADQQILEIKLNSHWEQKFPNPFSWQIRFFCSYFQKADSSISLIDLGCFSDLGRKCDSQLKIAEEENKLLDVPKREDKIIQAKDSLESSPFPWLKRLYISYLAGDSSWLNLNNYTSLGMLFASEPKASMAMVDFRGHCFNDRMFASNLGIVGRYVSLESKDISILGFSLYWDFREAYWINFNQLGFGFELLKSQWDLRGNLYYPVATKLKKHTKNLFYPGGFFWIQRDTERMFLLSGNMEIGGFLYHHSGFSFYVAAGPYCFLGRSKPIWGGEVRIQPQIMDCFSVNLRSNYDSSFRWTFQGEAILSFPLYQLKKKSPELCLKDRRIYQRVERCDIISIRRTFRLLNNF